MCFLLLKEKKAINHFQGIVFSYTYMSLITNNGLDEYVVMFKYLRHINRLAAHGFVFKKPRYCEARDVSISLMLALSMLH